MCCLGLFGQGSATQIYNQFKHETWYVGRMLFKCSNTCRDENCPEFAEIPDFFKPISDLSILFQKCINMCGGYGGRGYDDGFFLNNVNVF